MESYRPMIQNQIPNSPTLPPVPTTKDELLIAALRHANVVSVTLGAISAEVGRMLGEDYETPKWDTLAALLGLRLHGQSGVFLFIAAHNLGLELPPDLQGDEEDSDAE